MMGYSANHRGRNDTSQHRYKRKEPHLLTPPESVSSKRPRLDPATSPSRDRQLSSVSRVGTQTSESTTQLNPSNRIIRNENSASTQGRQQHIVPSRLTPASEVSRFAPKASPWSARSIPVSPPASSSSSQDCSSSRASLAQQRATSSSTRSTPLRHTTTSAPPSSAQSGGSSYRRVSPIIISSDDEYTAPVQQVRTSSSHPSRV
jgi:hypothetical protein